MSARKILLWIVVASAGIFGAVRFFSGPTGAPAPTEVPPPSASSPQSAPQGSSSAADAKPSGTSEGPRAETVAQWQAFAAKFGSELVPEFDAQGHLVAVRGQVGRGAKAEGGFQSNDPQKALARAKEILNELKGPLGLKDSLPLENPVARGNEISSQVFFRETIGGLPVGPRGSVTVDLGPQGEVIGVSSDYVVDLAMSGSQKIDAERARAIASGTGDSDRVIAEGGSRVAWIVGPGVARQAYEFTVQGHQVVVDSNTGAILFRRDRRVN